MSCRKQPIHLLASGAYLAAGLEVLALGVDALVVVDVVLPAVLGLVLVREAGVEALREEGCGLADWDVLVSRYGRIVVFGGYVCCVPAVKMSVSVSVSLSRLAGLICYAPVTNLKGMVTRSSSSDMFAVFLGGLDWVVCWWIGGPVLSLSL